jgi:hypothetical protein
VRVSPQILIDGIARTLQEQVVPHVDSRTARSQLWAVIDVLRNLSGRVEPAVAALEAESGSASGALGTFAARLRDSGHDALATATEARVAAAPPAPASARNDALRAALVAAFADLDVLPAEAAETLRPILGGHLAAQAVRGLANLQPSLLDEISRS